MRRYRDMPKSRGTIWPRDVAQAIADRDKSCVGPRVGMPGDCFGPAEKDHIRTGGMGMKSPSTVDNGILVCSTHHRMKTENGRTWRPVFLEYVGARA